MAAVSSNHPNTGSTPLRVKLDDGLKKKIRADNVKFSAYIRLYGSYMKCSKLGGDLRRLLELRGFVEVKEHHPGWYSAKFSCKWDYDQAFQATSWRIFGRYSIQVYRWQPNFQFGQVAPLAPLCAGDIVEGRVEGLTLEYWRKEVVIEIANAVCEPLGCSAFLFDTSSQGKLPRFFFESNGSDLPKQIQLDDCPVLGLSYSRAQRCYVCQDFGHTQWTCPASVSNPEPRQWPRSPNRATTPSSSGFCRTHVHRGPNVDSLSADPRVIYSDLLSGSGSGSCQTQVHHGPNVEPPIADPRGIYSDFPSGSGSCRTQVHRGPNVDLPIADPGGIYSDLPSVSCRTQVHRGPNVDPPIADPRGIYSDLPPLPLFPDEIGAGFQTGTLEQTSCPELDEETSPVAPIPGIPTSPPRTISEKKMSAKGAIIIEKGCESRPTLYTLGHEVSEIDVTVKVTSLHDQSGNQRHVTIFPHIGDGPHCIKRVVCTSIDGSAADVSHTLEDVCHNKGASLVVVLDKSSVLANDDHIGRRLGFSAFHRAEMTFRRFGADGSPLDVKGNCLLMWKREEVCVNVSVVDTELLSQHLKFSASWVIGKSDEEEPHGLFHGVEGPSDTSDGTTFDSSQESDLKGSSSSSTSVAESSSNYYDSTTSGSDLEGSSLYPTAPAELPSEPGDVSPIGTPDLSSNYGDFISKEESSCSSPRSESSWSNRAVFDESPPDSPNSVTLDSNYGDADSEGSYGYEPDAEGSSGDEMPYESDYEEDDFADAEEISVRSSAPTSPSSIYESDLEADSTTSDSAYYTFSSCDEHDTDSEGSTPYHSAAEEPLDDTD